MDIVSLDYETFSEADLTRVGSYNYARDPSTEILMVAWRINGGRKVQWDYSQETPPPPELKEALVDTEVQKWAWNAPFEMAISKYVWGVNVDIKQWRDTMVLGHYCGFPGQLEKAGPAAGLPEELCKNPDGKRLMKFFSMMNTSRKKANYGEKERKHWYHDLVKWDGYLEYNMDDVEAESQIRDILIPHDLPQWEWENWFLDQEINQAGLPINLEMVENAIRLYEHFYDRGITEMRELTGMEKPNAPQQLLPWIKENGYMFDDCKAGHIRQAISYFDECPEHWTQDQWEVYTTNEGLRDVLSLRLELSRTSIKKFYALRDGTSPDGNLRNVLQFMGASRTGRWSGRTFQPQNLPRPEKYLEKGIELHAANIQRLDPESFDLIYTNPFDVLASCIRPAAQAPEGQMFADADLNAIENRVLGWMSGCKKILRVFEMDRDPYVDFGTYLFDASYDRLWEEYKSGDSSKRTISKPGVLGCLKGDTPVLTQCGWKAIVELTCDDWLHDGEKWVRHSGVVYKGEQKVYSRSGIHATPDHKFLTQKGWKECQQAFHQPMFKSALAMGTGVSENDEVRPGAPDNSFYASVNVTENESYQDQTWCEDYPDVAPDVLQLTVAPILGNESVPSCSTYFQVVSTLRDRVARMSRTIPTLITEEGEFSWHSIRQRSGSHILLMNSVRTGPLKWTGSTTTTDTEKETLDWQHDQSKTPTADTWDILNTGEYARFAVLTEDGCLIAHNCGYMLGPGKKYENRQTGEIEATGLLGYAWNMGVKHFTPEQSKLSVDTFRREFEEVKEYWYTIERAAIKCVQEKRTTVAGPVSFDLSGDFLRMSLPSGRYLHYYKPLIEPVKMPWKDRRGGPVWKDSLTYEGVDDKKRWMRMSTHPGKLTENGDQAISRDLLVHGMRIARWDYGLDIRLHVHDQNIALAADAEANEALEILIQAMGVQPDWAEGLPLGSAGFTSPVFKKD